MTDKEKEQHNRLGYLLDACNMNRLCGGGSVTSKVGARVGLSIHHEPIRGDDGKEIGTKHTFGGISRDGESVCFTVLTNMEKLYTDAWLDVDGKRLVDNEMLEWMQKRPAPPPPPTD